MSSDPSGDVNSDTRGDMDSDTRASARDPFPSASRTQFPSVSLLYRRFGKQGGPPGGGRVGKGVAWEGGQLMGATGQAGTPESSCVFRTTAHSLPARVCLPPAEGIGSLGRETRPGWSVEARPQETLRRRGPGCAGHRGQSFYSCVLVGATGNLPADPRLASVMTPVEGRPEATDQTARNGAQEEETQRWGDI